MKNLLFFFYIFLPGFAFAQFPVFDGSFILDRNAGSAHSAVTCDIDNAGFIHVAGQFYGTCDFDPSIGDSILNTNFGNPCYVARYDAGLNFQWVSMLIGNGDSTIINPTKVLADNAGNSLVAGFHASTFDADPGTGVHTLSGFPFNYSGFIVALNPNGNYLWSAQFGSLNNHCRIYDMVQSSSGTYYFCGDFNDSIDFDPGPGTQLRVAALNTSGSFVLELDANGNFVQIFTWDQMDLARCIDLDTAGNIYVGGAYSGTVDFDLGPNDFSLTSSWVTLTGFVMSMDPSGNFRWASHFRDAAGNSTCVVNDFAVSDLLVGIAGHFDVALDLDPGNGMMNVTAAGNYDHFFVGLSLNTGSYVWGGRSGSPQLDNIRSMVVDEDGDFWINGISQGNTDLNPDPNSAVNYSFGPNAVPWIMRLDNNGNYEWSGTQGGAFLNGEYDNSIAVASGSVCFMGMVSNNMNLDPITNSFPTSVWDYYGAYLTKLCMPIELFNTVALCPGDSVFLQGAWQHSAGFFTDVFTRWNGCDSVVNTSVFVPDLNFSLGNDTSFCNGQLFLTYDSPGMEFLWNTGAPTFYLFIDTSGVYALTISNPLGNCSATDSILVINGLLVNAFLPDTVICMNGGNYPLSGGNPVGGTWSGLGVSNNIFNPQLAGIGQHWLSYTVMDSLGCQGSDSVFVSVDLCTALEENDLNGYAVLPNPSHEFITISNKTEGMQMRTFDPGGREVFLEFLGSNKFDVAHLEKGLYISKLYQNRQLIGISKWIKN